MKIVVDSNGEKTHCYSNVINCHCSECYRRLKRSENCSVLVPIHSLVTIDFAARKKDERAEMTDRSYAAISFVQIELMLSNGHGPDGFTVLW